MNEFIQKHDVRNEIISYERHCLLCKNLTPNGNKWASLANQLSLVIYLLMTN